MLGSGKFGKFGELSVLRQTLTTQILAYQCILMAKIYPFAKLFFPTTFDLAIRQTFLLYSICTHIYIIITLVIFC